jgi:hypothetical protein
MYVSTSDFDAVMSLDVIVFVASAALFAYSFIVAEYCGAISSRVAPSASAHPAAVAAAIAHHRRNSAAATFRRSISTVSVSVALRPPARAARGQLLIEN